VRCLLGHDLRSRALQRWHVPVANAGAVPAVPGRQRVPESSAWEHSRSMDRRSILGGSPLCQERWERPRSLLRHGDIHGRTTPPADHLSNAPRDPSLRRILRRLSGERSVRRPIAAAPVRFLSRRERPPRRVRQDEGKHVRPEPRLLHVHGAAGGPGARRSARHVRPTAAVQRARSLSTRGRDVYRALSNIVVVAAGLSACGSRSMLDDPTNSAPVTPRAACRSWTGTRICGGPRPCAEIPPPECPGYGCTYGYDIATGQRGSGGICWADLADHGDEACYACPDGDECMARSPGELVCVPSDVCDALWDEGIRDVCRYADKGAYDGRSLPASPSGCPGGAAGTLCGGGCGECTEYLARCTGRSPDHPWGVCAIDPEHVDPSWPNAYLPLRDEREWCADHLV
jgi:hypothetical protein